MTGSMKKIIGAIVLLFLAVIMAWSLTVSVTVKAAPDDTTDWSLAQQSTAAAQYFSHCLSPASQVDGEGNALDSKDILPSVTFGSAGGMLGYLDIDVTKDDQNFWAAPGSTKNQTEYPYQSLQGIGGGDFYEYAAYGHALNYLGLDQTAAPNANTGLRWFVGLLMMILYVLSMGVNMVFSFALTALRVLNPFRLFMGNGSGNVILEGMDSFTTAYKDSDSDVTKAMVSGVDNLSAKLRHLYSTSSNIGTMVVMPVLTALLLMSLTLFHNKPVGKNTTAFQKIKPWVLRLAFIAFGVPLMFSCYDVVLSNLSNQVAVSNTMGTRMIASTFIDFDSWATTYNLSLPAGELNVGDDSHTKATIILDANGVPTAETVAHTRKLTYDINRITGSFGDLGEFSQIETLHTNTSTSDTSSKTVWQSNTSDQKDITDNFANAMNVIGILQKYMNGDVVSSAAFEANVVKTKLDAEMSDSAKLKGINQMFLDGCTWTNWQKAVNEEAEKRLTAAIGAGYGPAADWSNAHNIWGSSWDSAASKSDGSDLSVVYYGRQDFNYINVHLSQLFSKIKLIGSDMDAYRGLSDMSMYNYLNSSFTETSVIVYSPTASNSAVTRQMHYAVNNVGNGLNSILYLLDAMAIMGCVAILGYAYALGLLFENFKAIFKIIPNVFLGLAGSMKGIATVVAYTIAMILEVIVTIFLYCLACDLVVAAVDIIENPLAILFRTSGGNAFVKVLHPVLMIASIVLVCILVKKALEWRKVVIQGITESATAVINKFLGANAPAPQLTSNAGGKLARVATVGAGAIMLGAATSGSSGLATSSVGQTVGAVGDNLGVTQSANDTAAAFGVKTTGGTTNTDAYSTNYGGSSGGSVVSADNYANADENVNVANGDENAYSDADVDNSSGATANMSGDAYNDEYADNYSDDSMSDQRALSETQQAEAYNEANSDLVERVDSENQEMYNEQSASVATDNSQTDVSARDITAQEITDQQRNITENADDVVNLFNPDANVRNQAWSNVQQGWKNAQDIHADANAKRAALTSNSAVTTMAANNIVNNNNGQEDQGTAGQQSGKSDTPVKGSGKGKTFSGRSNDLYAAGQNGMPNQRNGQQKNYDPSRGFNARPMNGRPSAAGKQGNGLATSKDNQAPNAGRPQNTGSNYNAMAPYMYAANNMARTDMEKNAGTQNKGNATSANRVSAQNANRGQAVGQNYNARATQQGRTAASRAALQTRRPAGPITPTPTPTKGRDVRPKK